MVHKTKRTTMRLEEFLDKYNIEPTEIHYDIEMSWSDFTREHPKIAHHMGGYEKWLKENRGWIKDIVQTLPEAKKINLK